jgi:hypothetical protein
MEVRVAEHNVQPSCGSNEGMIDENASPALQP